MSRLQLANPVLSASGCGGTGRELAAFVDPARLGAFVTRTITVAGRPGGLAPRIEETPAGLVNAVGLPNPGIDGFLATELPWLVRQGVRVIVSIAGATLGEYTELTRRLALAPGVGGLEVNLSAPDAEGLGLYDAREPIHAASVIGACRRDLPGDLPLLAKLRPEVRRAVEAARTVVEAGADAVVLGNALPAAFSDGRPGGLSGPAVRPIALRCVSEVSRALPDVAVIGAGGITGADDVRTFLDAGAVAVQVGTAQLHDPATLGRILDDLDEHPAATTGEFR